MNLAEALTALREAATPGVWDVETLPETGESRVYVPPVDLLRDDYMPVAPGGVTQADAELIVALVNNLPEIVAALQAVEKVRRIHRPLDAVEIRSNTRQQVCTGCGTDAGNWERWPCPTIRALGGVS